MTEKTALPMPWVDRIFTKLTLVYGRPFMARYEGLDTDAVKADWAHELASFTTWPEALAYALSNLPPDRPPTVLEFRAIARRAPQKAGPIMLPPPPADRAAAAHQLAELLARVKARAKTARPVDGA
ncbi:MAG: hypothetical protein ACK50S_00185 [bacterium]|jgi:hypothetical protein